MDKDRWSIEFRLLEPLAREKLIVLESMFEYNFAWSCIGFR